MRRRRHRAGRPRGAGRAHLLGVAGPRHRGDQFDDQRPGGRLAEVWRPLGLGHELRVVFRADGTSWGAAGLVRRGEFSDREVEFLTSVTPRRRRRRGWPPAPGTWGSGRNRRSWSSARTARSGRPTAAWRSELDEIAPGRFTVLLVRAAATGTFRARVRDAHGGWIAACGLTARERDICREVPAGLSTTDIAARPAISAHTVQGHLKSVFGKVGVRSRGHSCAGRKMPGNTARTAVPALANACYIPQLAGE